VRAAPASTFALVYWRPGRRDAADDLRDELRSAHTLASKIRKDLAEFKDFKPDIPDGDRKFKPKHDETEGVVRMQRNLYVGLSQKFSSVLGEMTKVADSFQQVDKKPTDQYYKPGMRVVIAARARESKVVLILLGRRL